MSTMQIGWQGGAKTRFAGQEPFLPLSFSSYKSKMNSFIDKKKQAEQRARYAYGISQQYLKGLTDKYVQFVNTLDRKYCRLLVGLITG